MQEKIFTGTDISFILEETQNITKYNSIKWWSKEKELDPEDLVCIFYETNEEKEEDFLLPYPEWSNTMDYGSGTVVTINGDLHYAKGINDIKPLPKLDKQEEIADEEDTNAYREPGYTITIPFSSGDEIFHLHLNEVSTYTITKVIITQELDSLTASYVIKNENRSLTVKEKTIFRTKQDLLDSL